MKRVSILDKWLWMLMSIRKVERNSTSLFVSFGFSLFLFAGLAILVWLYHVAYLFPEVIAFVIGGCLVAAGFPFLRANELVISGIVNLIFGAAGYVFKWDLGLSLLSLHFEKGLFLLFVIAGALSVVRYIWNGMLWYRYDKIKHRFPGVSR